MDPFRTLGVSRDASEADIKAAFRNAALKHHPDVHATAPEAVRKEAEVLFRAVNEAYQSLTDGEALPEGTNANTSKTNRK